MKEPDVKKSLADRGYEPIGNTPEEQQVRTATLVNQWIEVGKTVNLKE